MTRQQLKQARESLGLNIGEMAELIKTPRGTYVKWENGERRVPGFLDVLLPFLILVDLPLYALKEGLSIKGAKQFIEEVKP